MWLSSWSWGKHSWGSVPLLVARGASLPGVSNGCMVVKSTVGSPFCLNPKLLRIFLVVKQDCVLTRERKNMVWGHVGERDHIKTRGYRRDISSEGCMCLMSVFPIWLEIIIWSRKPQESHLHNGASGKCLFSVESQQSNKRVGTGVCSGPCCTQSTVFTVRSKQGRKQSSVLSKSKCLCST